jgi:hypothetical protein
MFFKDPDPGKLRVLEIAIRIVVIGIIITVIALVFSGRAQGMRYHPEGICATCHSS